MLSIDPDLANMIIRDEYSVRKGGRCAEDAVGRAERGDGAVADVDKLAVRHAGIDDVVREHYRVAAGLYPQTTLCRLARQRQVRANSCKENLSRLKEQPLMLMAEESSTKKAAPRWMDQSPPEGHSYESM